ncbi:MAG: hypothetical protein KBT00_02920 [Bacteroidales bacterium]|nr:hypothetical protein [Candidatus Cacconaster merdequi]
MFVGLDEVSGHTLVTKRPYQRTAVLVISLLETEEPFLGVSLLSGMYVSSAGQEIEIESVSDELDWGTFSVY